ncbi:hypothetical protein CNMCM8927_002717 [Aspergillus lentulus]|nr:hypothetical protein CNMCM6069_009306 [Aspergillus lentulus]KAF4181840.1 hypothetical protein CNMCM8060_008211 [Aspergillus lentulus]KAF4189790.1 hypothetical protein CNMCM7927_006574 [Aspergillus lentulus]KAF4207640.1 hypothetical protein CNMCM8927_002717 [Aspergillus lentulus]
MSAKGPHNTPKASLLILLCCSLFINAADGTTATLTESTAYASQRPCAKSCFYWGSSTQGGADFLAERIGCEVDPILNECICRSDLQQTADSFLRKCVSDNCGANAIDVSSAVGIYDDYCTSNGYTRATSTAQTTRTTSSDGAGVWGSTSAASSPWTTVKTRLTVVDAIVSTSQASTATSTSEKGSDRTTESTKQSVPSVTQTSTSTIPTTSSGTGEEDKTGQGSGSQLKVGEIVGIVVGILGFIATAAGSWFSYKTLKQRKRLANPP